MGKIKWFEEKLKELESKPKDNWTDEEYKFVIDTLIQTLDYNKEFLLDIDKTPGFKKELKLCMYEANYDWKTRPANELAYNCFMFARKNWRLLDWAFTGWKLYHSQEQFEKWEAETLAKYSVVSEEYKNVKASFAQRRNERRTDTYENFNLYCPGNNYKFTD